jgi:iron(III) transport system substrate-binding protein
MSAATPTRPSPAAYARAIAVLAVALVLACAPAAPRAAPAPPAGGTTAAPQGPAAHPPALQALIDGARQEGRLELVWSQSTLRGSAGARTMQDAINQKYGLDLSLNFTPGPAGPSIGARIVQEAAAGQPSHTDVQAISVYPDIFEAFEPVDWRQYVPSLPPEVIHFNGRGVAWGTLVPGITYNSQLVPPDRAPQSLDDLLKPEYRGKVAAPPYVVGRGVYATPDYVGHDRWFTFWRQYTRQVSGLMRCGEADRILSGEFPIFAIDCGGQEARAAQRAGKPLGHVIPAEGAPLRYWIAGVPITAPHPNAAKLFIIHLLSREGQDFAWDAEATDSYRLPGSKIAEVVKSYEDRGVKFIEEQTLLDKYPQIADYEKEMLAILQQAQ